MTDFIRSAKLLPDADIDEIIATAPADLVVFQEGAAAAPRESRPHPSDWLDCFNPATKEAV